MEKYIAIIFILIVIAVSLFFFYLFFDDLVGNCSAYSATERNGLDEANSQHPCVSDGECRVVMYYPCKTYGISNNVNLTELYEKLNLTHPSGCPYAGCKSPDDYKAVCENGLCGVKKIA
jgi:hypothetical protein